MKSTISKIVLAICVGLLSMPALGQDLIDAYQKTVDEIFSGIPTEKITTGILIERAPSFVNMYRYEGANKEKITFEAGNEVILNPGFEVQSGGIFEVNMINCVW